MSRSYALAFLSVLSVGCSAPESLSKACIPVVDCSAIDTIKLPPDCALCPACQDAWGSCSPGGSACKRGSLDLDPAAPLCESTISDAQGQWVMHSTGDVISFFQLNQGVFPSAMTVPVLAYQQDDQSCVPTFTQSCAYTINALQLEIPDFSVPENSWSNGVATLNGPIAALDDGTGVGVYAPMQFVFEVQQGSKRKIALSQGWANIGIIRGRLQGDPREYVSLTIQVASIDFGGYQITDLYFDSMLDVPN